LRLVFVHWVYEDRGSAQDLHNYARVAKALGHEVVVYGRPDAGSFDYSLAVDTADGVIFIVEWTTALQRGDQLDWVRLTAGIPRERRVVVDCDGKYNGAISVIGDYNHPDADASRAWISICDSLADKVYQPTLHPLRKNVGTFLFHAYNAAWEKPLDLGGKEYGMFYVGNNWFRWGPLRRVLDAVQRVRGQVGRLGVTGHGWDSPPPWANSTVIQAAYYSDYDYLRELGVEVHPPVHFNQVIDLMGRGVFTPVIYRPLFDHLELVTCRTFETIAANTIPLFGHDPEFVEEIYGHAARELVLPTEQPEAKIADIMSRPDYYAEIVEILRQHLAERHSYAVRLNELIEIVKS
jgi:hypothetical protein